MTSELERTAPAAMSPRAELIAGAALICGFVGMVWWFDAVDVYHRHYFDHGPIVIADNAMRIVFVGIFSWLIYAPGAAIVTLLTAPAERAALSPAERAVLGFGIGIGIWHGVMLILGILGLYYRPVMAGLCFVIVVVSSRHFARVAFAGCRALIERWEKLRQYSASPQEVGAILIGAAALWLLLRRGLYPGGSNDYFSHYFYYYLEVLRNHSVAPNDVWYHYYQSKGSGLVFLGMLLSDPEATALTTFSCVIFAAVAVATLAARMAPRSLWPAAAALIYLLYYLLTFNGVGEGEFQKDHEQVTALVVLTVWALCMECCCPPRPFRVMAAASAIAAAIITQAVGVVLGVFVGLLCAWSILRRRWSDMWNYFAIGAAITGTVLAILIFNYLQTGLATDQPLEPMLWLTDTSRLDRWGVIPQVIAESWVRDNYRALVPPIGWGVLKELAQFSRLDTLWPLLAVPAAAIAIFRMVDVFTATKPVPSRDAAAASFALSTLGRLVLLIGLFFAVALTAGRAQSYSFFRLSTFFVPLLALLTVAGCLWMLNRRLGRWRDPWLWTVLPAVLLFAVVGSWQGKHHWSRRVPEETADALRFVSGRFSFADAYAHLHSGYLVSAINPAALAAARQLPPGTPIWSTNVETFCMAPGCLIEDALNFKMSGRLDEILGGDPELAKRRLQEAGLNYFLFTKDYRLMDLLPYSPLFAPETIGRYLGIKWSDGSTFMLTWIGADTTPIGPDFLDAYTRRRAQPDASQWFRFDELAPVIVAMSPRLRQARHWGPEVGKLLSWR